jgi:hypothetical protein
MKHHTINIVYWHATVPRSKPTDMLTSTLIWITVCHKLLVRMYITL